MSYRGPYLRIPPSILMFLPAPTGRFLTCLCLRWLWVCWPCCWSVLQRRWETCMHTFHLSTWWTPLCKLPSKQSNTLCKPLSTCLKTIHHLPSEKLSLVWPGAKTQAKLVEHLSHLLHYFPASLLFPNLQLGINSLPSQHLPAAKDGLPASWPVLCWPVVAGQTKLEIFQQGEP